MAGGWGQPNDWLTEAAEYVHHSKHITSPADAGRYCARPAPDYPATATAASTYPPALTAVGMSDREAEVLDLVAQGLTSKQSPPASTYRCALWTSMWNDCSRRPGYPVAATCVDSTRTVQPPIRQEAILAVEAAPVRAHHRWWWEQIGSSRSLPTALKGAQPR